MADPAFRIDRFGGLNVRETSDAIADNELSDVENFDLGDAGELRRRTGFEQKHNGATLGANSVHILGFFNTGTYKQFIARSGSQIYFSLDAIAWTIIAGGPYNDVEWGVQYTDKFYMVRKAGTMLEWNGLTVSALASSPSGTYCKVFKDRMFVLNSETAGVNASRLYFSEPFDFTATGWPATNYVGVQEGDGDWLIAVENVQDSLIVFKTSSIHILYVQGSETLAWILRPFNKDVGCISKYSLVSHEGSLFFVGPLGVYETNGSSVQTISSPVGPLFSLITVAIATINTVSAFVWQDKYVVTLPAFAVPPLWSEFNVQTWDQLSNTLWAGGSVDAVTLVYHIKQGAWTKWRITGINPHKFVTVFATSILKGVYSGSRSADGKVFKYGSTLYTDNLFSYVSRFDTKNFHFEKPSEKKRGKWISVSVDGAGSYETRSICDETRNVISTDTVTVENEIKVKGPGYFRIWKFNLRHLGTSRNIVYGLSMYISSRDYRPNKVNV